MLLLLSLGITVLGLLGSWAVYRRRGAGPAMRGAAWSLVPIGAYLTGTTKFLTDLVLSPSKWAGVILIALAVVLYVTSGVMLRKGSGQDERPAKKDRAKDSKDAKNAKGGKAPKERKPKGAVEQSKPDLAGLGDDLGDIEEILKRRGIS